MLYMVVVLDSAFRLVFTTDELRRSLSGLEGCLCSPRTAPFGPEAMSVRKNWVLLSDVEQTLHGSSSRRCFPSCSLTTSGGRPAPVRELVDPRFHDLVDDLAAGQPLASFAYQDASNRSWGIDLKTWHSIFRVYVASDRSPGTCGSQGLGGMSMLGTMAGGGDLRHLERIQDFVHGRPTPGGDLVRRSRSVVTAGPAARNCGLLHARPTARPSCPSVRGRRRRPRRPPSRRRRHRLLPRGGPRFGVRGRAVRRIHAARTLRDTAADIAERSGIAPDDVVLRFGLHWGSDALRRTDQRSLAPR